MKQTVYIFLISLFLQVNLFAQIIEHYESEYYLPINESVSIGYGGTLLGGYSITPSLPAGLTINDMGNISGKTTVQTPLITYTVGAQGYTTGFKMSTGSK